MKPYLLDTNVLLALTWPNHVHHPETRAWFKQKGAARFRTCPLTQTGFVRISSNPAFTAEAVSPADAMSLLRRLCSMPGHQFWPNDLSLAEAVPAWGRLAVHRQVTDAYLLALAASHEGILATLDRAISALVSGKCDECVEFI